MNTTIENPNHTTDWRIARDPIDYPDAIARMEQRVADIIAGRENEQIWMVEHPPVYTAGTSADRSDILRSVKTNIPVVDTGRGGQVTYHGPGQRVVYAMLDLKRRDRRDLHAYITWLQSWGQRALKSIGIDTVMRGDRIGLWVPAGRHGLERESKIMALGVRVKRWVTYHGMAINLNPDLSHFDGIVPCGIDDYGVTSVRQCGLNISMDDLDQALRDTYHEFGSG